MPGLFGPVAADGGPGSIWKIDGRSGHVTLFANVLLDGRPNSGPALGGLVFEPYSRQLLVSDRETGMIHRFGLDGVDRGHLDHGAQVLPAIGLPAVAFDRSKRLDLQNPAFVSANPSTWAYAPDDRRVFGLGVRGSRLFYAVAAGRRVWSIAILPDGSFGTDVRLEFELGSGKPGTEVSKILFDDDGRMLLAQRGAPTGTYDYGALATEASGGVIRLRPKLSGFDRTPGLWEIDGDYAVGFPPDFQNGNGGAAIGYGYDAIGNINTSVCGGWLWSSGERLRMSPDPAIARLLLPGGGLAIHGLQGNASQLLRPLNAPPFTSYFINGYPTGEQPAWSAHAGDLAIWRVCPRAEFYPLFWGLVADYVTDFCPAGYASIRDRCVPTSCKPGELYRDGKCVPQLCPPDRRNTLRSECCPEGSVWQERACRPRNPKGPDLTIVKEIANCRGSGPCGFKITVTNNGPGQLYRPAGRRRHPKPRHHYRHNGTRRLELRTRGAAG